MKKTKVMILKKGNENKNIKTKVNREYFRAGIIL